ncbi:aldo/keto reductase [Tenggerimyces flavus]|uniref:Aldo/keto reductase n=1 Tax=Tenggerimyces flavus TaxID=1708749 RepID=A0ABV7YDS8_9ACTN|nr:aldo/keto reductase [Tenggerimyces flavus]MBM7788055.1 aryl-alcohol dehydrogenase-like predicted oxidoreductase [Tenggerimyces flavus]
MRQLTIGDEYGKLSVSAFSLGTIPFGTGWNEQDSFALLDRFAEAGGTFVDTADSYNQWHPGARGGESEETIGRWLKARGNRDEIVIATKNGALTTDPNRPSDLEVWAGLAGKAIRQSVEGNLRRLGVERIDLYYAHIDDRAVPLEETVETMAALVQEGKVGVIGCSNTALWRLERARAHARSLGLPRYSCIQQMHTYLWPRPDKAQIDTITPELQDYARVETDLALLGYKPVMNGAYTWNGDRTFPLDYDHPTNAARMRTLLEVADELGTNPYAVIVAWMLQSDPVVIPVSAARTVEQLDAQLAGVELHLEPELLRRLNEAGTESVSF